VRNYTKTKINNAQHFKKNFTLLFIKAHQQSFFKKFTMHKVYFKSIAKNILMWNHFLVVLTLLVWNILYIKPCS